MNVLECVRIDITNRLLLTAFSNYRIVLVHNTIHLLLLPLFHSLFGSRWFCLPFALSLSLLLFFFSITPTVRLFHIVWKCAPLACWLFSFHLSPSLSLSLAHPVPHPSNAILSSEASAFNMCTIVWRKGPQKRKICRTKKVHAELQTHWKPREKERAEKWESMKISRYKRANRISLARYLEHLIVFSRLVWSG